MTAMEQMTWRCSVGRHNTSSGAEHTYAAGGEHLAYPEDGAVMMVCWYMAPIVRLCQSFNDVSWAVCSESQSKCLLHT